MTDHLMHIIREKLGLDTYGVNASLQKLTDQLCIFFVSGTYSKEEHDGDFLTKVSGLVGSWLGLEPTQQEIDDKKQSMQEKLDRLNGEPIEALKLFHTKRLLEIKNDNYSQIVKKATIIKVHKAVNKYIDPTKLFSVLVTPS